MGEEETRLLVGTVRKYQKDRRGKTLGGIVGQSTLGIAYREMRLRNSATAGSEIAGCDWQVREETMRVKEGRAKKTN